MGSRKRGLGDTDLFNVADTSGFSWKCSRCRGPVALTDRELDGIQEKLWAGAELEAVRMLCLRCAVL